MIGQTLSHYRILDELGSGGMGTVYRAQDTKLDRSVALKFLAPHLAQSEEEKRRFVQEARAASSLDHPNICTIFEIGDMEDGRMFIAMACYEGESLKDRIGRGALPVDEALGFALQVARGLEKAHARGIIHRDIKPANILLTEDGQVKIVDFGLAKLSGHTVLTREGTTLGTAAYMSPEQATGRGVDHRTDIWSLGVVLYEMLAGERPFRGHYEQAVIYAILNEDPEPLRALNSSVPQDVEAVVLKALSKKPAGRFPTMQAFREELHAVVEGTSPRPVGRMAAAVKLAVLPLVNLTGDPDQEFFSDGLTMEMIAQLGRLHPQSLSVIARTSVMRYKKSDVSIDQIGRELGVDYVLEGSAQREGSRVRIIAELIRVEDQTQLWGDIFEREMSGILSLQNEVSQKVAGALALKLLPSEKALLAHARPVDPEAHEAFLRGMYFSQKVTPADLNTAEEYFDLALEKDLSYAPAYAGRAWVWAIRNQMGFASPEEAVPKAKDAARRALELDTDSADAHQVLAGLRAFTDWDWEAAGESWRRTLELNGNAAVAQALYAHFLAITGHVEEARSHSEKAAVLDPFNPLIQSWHAQIVYSQRKFDEAIALAREAQRIHPNHPIVGFTLWITLHQKEELHQEAFEAIKATMVAVYEDSRIAASLLEGYARGGYAEAMKCGAEALIARLPEAFSLPNDIGNFYVAAGEKEKAVEWFCRGLEVHDPVSPYLGCFPLYDDLRPDPSFQDLLRKMRLPFPAISRG